MSDTLVKVNELQRAIAEVATVEDAATLANQAAALADVCRRANLGLQVQNEAAALRLHAERKLGELLTATVKHGGNPERGSQLNELGISGNRSSRAQKLAALPDETFTNYLASTIAAGKEITHSGALKLSPTQPKPDRANIADTYTAPPVDVAIAQQYGLEADDDLAELIAASIAHALHADITNPRHAYVWAKYHGLQDDGTVGESWSFDGIAKQMGTTSGRTVTREYVEGLYYRADSKVFRRMSRDLLNALKLVLNSD